jgi:hypothetical protein
MGFVSGNYAHTVTVSILENELAFMDIDVIPAPTFLVFLRPCI